MVFVENMSSPEIFLTTRFVLHLLLSQILGPIMSNRMVRTIFAFVQQEEEELEDDDDEEGGDNEMVYSEFCEVAAAMACVLNQII